MGCTKSNSKETYKEPELVNSINANANIIIEAIMPKEDNYESLEEDKNAIWIDPSIFNEYNELYYDYFMDMNIRIDRFDNIDESFDFLNKKENEFKNIKIIISGKLFNDFYYRIKRNIISIKFKPTIIIFTNKIDLLINQLKMNNIYYFNDIFDTKLIFDEPSKIVDFINNKNQEGIEETDLTFDIINNLEQLIVPNYYPFLLDEVNRTEIEYFNYYLINNYSSKNEKNEITNNNEIHNLIFQIKNNKTPKELLIQYWLRIYTLQSEFFIMMNKSLRKKDKDSYLYNPFIRLCYEGIKKGFLKSYNKEIYRYSKISKKEFKEISIKYNQNKNNIFPSIIVFARSFLSFSVDKNAIETFKNSDNDSYCILYIIEEIKNIENIDKKISNVVLKDYSKYEYEKEILVLPHSCFEIVDIKEIKNDGIDYKIKLKYLGYYSNYIEEQFGKNFFDKIQISHFSEDLIESGIIKNQNFFSTWFEYKNMEIILDKICFFLDGEEDCIGFLKNNIYIFNIHLSKSKQIIKIHEKQIINIIKITKNRICSSSEDRTIKILKMLENNEKYQLIKIIESYANKIIFLNNENILYINENNAFKIFSLEDEANSSRELFKEKDKILYLEKINNDRIVYLSEDDALIKIIKFINLKDCKKEENQIIIEEDNNDKLIFIDLLVFNDYILVAFNWRLDIIYFKDKNLNLKSFKYFDFEIKQLIILSSNRLIIGFNDSEKKESIIREHLLRIKDLQNDRNQFDCIGQGIVKSQKIENIIKINESQILINIRNNSCLIFERKNEVSEKLKKSLIANGKIKKEENRIKNSSEISKYKDIKNKEINTQKSDFLNNKNKLNNIKFQNEPYYNIKTVENKKLNNNINIINNDIIQNKNEKTESNEIKNNLAQQILNFLPEAFNTKAYESNSKNYNKDNYKLNFA